MSLVGLVNLAERLLNQGSTQGQDPQTAQKAASTPPTRGAQGTAEDLFTPSAQNALAQDAGLFSVAQLSFFSAAADFLLGQATPQQPAAAPLSTRPRTQLRARHKLQSLVPPQLRHWPTCPSPARMPTPLQQQPISQLPPQKPRQQRPPRQPLLPRLQLPLPPAQLLAP